MKRIIILLFFILTNTIYAQNSGITYQAVIYDPVGEILPGNNNQNTLLANKDICLRFSIKDATSNLEYQETQKVKTDEFGMVNLVVGQGDQVGGYASNFNAIFWNSTTKKLQVEMDITGNCSIFIEVSNQNFSAVPFAYASKTAENVSGIVAIANGGTGASSVSGAKTNLGLNNVDNTSDANKPISTATQTALDTKAPLASPALTGIPTVPTAANGTNTNQIASTAFVQSAITAAATPDATATVKGKLQLTGDLGGTADAPTVPGLVLKAPLDSPQFTGTPSLPTGTKAVTQAANDNSTAVATTAYVANALSASNANARSTDLDMAGNSISNALAVRAGNLQIVDEELHPFFGGTDDNAVTILNRENNVTQFLDGRTGSPILAITNSVNSNDVFGTPTAEEGKIGIGTTTPSEKLEVKGKIKAESFIKENGTASQFLKADGSVDNTQYAGLSSPVFTGTPTLPTGTIAVTQAANDNSTAVATTAFVNSAVAASTIADATDTVKGKLRLRGDLGGTADAPTVPALANKENTIAFGSTAQYWRGDKTWQTLDKATVGLGNVDNTSDASKPISTDTQAALDLKANLASPTFTGDAKTVTAIAGDSDTSIATTAFVTSAITNAATPDATTLSLGKIQLGGDLAGAGSSAASPIISNNAISTVKIADEAVTPVKIQAGSNDSVLVTDATGTVAWLDKGSFGAVADLSTIEGVGTTANPFKIKDLGIITAKLKNGAVTTDKLADNSVTNAKIGEIVSVENGGTGSNMTTTAGYVKQATTGANLTTVSSIPVADVSGAVRSVNGALPATDGNVSVLIGNVYTGNVITPTTGTAPVRSDIYIVAGQTGTPNDNGRTFIYDGTTWHEISTNIAALDNTFVKLSGSTMSGNLVFPTGKKITIEDAPIGSTDVTNKDYVDTKIGGTGTINFVPKFSAVKTLTDSSIFDNGNVGIGTTTPGNKLEITQGTAGNSGLRLTNLTSSSSATTTSNKVLGVNNNGDVILTNVPGTQNIVTFSTANPNSGSPVFTPNTQTDQSVIYQSSVDNSLWTYNGTTYVTYTAPATTAWNLANTINDAGSNKTSSIWRSGGIAVGGSSTSPLFGNITALGGTNFSGVPAFGTASIGLINNSTAGWIGSGFLFSNSTIGTNAFSMVYNNDKAYFGHLTPSNTYSIYGIWNGTGLKLGGTTNAINKLDVEGSTAIGSYAGINAAPSNGLIVSGNVGIGTNAPATRLQVNSSIATNTVNTEGIFRLQRPQNPGVKWENIAQFNLGSYAVTTGGSTNATSRLDLAMNDGDGVATSNIMTWFANGNVGIGTTAPISAFSNTSSAIQGSNSTNAFTGGFTWSSPGTGFAGSFYSQPTNGNGLQVKVAGNTSSTNALEISSGATQTGSLTPLFNVLGNGNVGVGTTSPLTRLIVNDNTYIANIPSSSTNLMDNSTFRPLTRFQATSGINNNAISHYLTTTAAATQAHNYSTGVTLPYILQPAGGNVGIGTISPSSTLHLNNPTLATNSVNADAPVLRLSRPQTVSTKWDNIAQFNLGSYSNSTVSATSRLDLALSDGAGTTTSNVMTWQANGNIGVGTTAPTAQLHTTGSVRLAGAGTPGVGRVLTSDANGNATWQYNTVNTRTADFQLAATDYGTVIVVNSTTPVTVTIPSTLPSGFYCQIIQQGAGQVNVQGSGVTVISALGTFSRTTGSSVGIMLTSSTSAYLSGDTAF